ncbi:MAG TPA: LptA/OstA family protein [Chthoniobacterales bacterium]
MKKLVTLFGIIVCFATFRSALAQQKPGSVTKSSPAPAAASRSPGTKRPSNSTKPASGTSQKADSSQDLFGDDSKDRPKGPTEITATQEAQFDTKTRVGVFIGNVKVVDPQFTMTSDRLTVHLNKDQEGGGLNDAEANGNVIIVHINQPKTQVAQAQSSGPTPPPTPAAVSGQPGARTQQPVTSTGKAEKALYEAKDGSITLTGWPQVTQGANTHIATAPGVKMVLYKDGRMQTYGSTRTLIEDRTAAGSPNTNGSH